MKLFSKTYFIILLFFFVACEQRTGVFNEEEKDWIKKNKGKIDALFGYDAPPSAFHNEEGEYVGMSVDFLKEIEYHSGLKFNIKNFETWDSLLQYSKNNHNFIIIGIALTPQRLKYLNFTDALVKAPYVIVTNTKSDISSIQDLKDKKVCSPRGYAVNDFIANNYPFIKPEYVKNDLEGLRAVSLNLYDAVLINQMNASFISEYEAISNIKIVSELDYTNRLGVGISNKDEILFKILDKSVDKISKEKRQKIYKKWLFNREKIIPRQTVIILVIVLVSIFLIALLQWAWLKTLRIQVKKKTKKIEEISTRLNDIIKHNRSMFYVHNLEGVFIYLSPQSKELLGCEPDKSKLNWQDFITDNPVNKLAYKYTNEAIRTGIKQPEYSVEFKDFNGAVKWFSVDESPVVENGKTKAIVGSITNITEHVERENKLLLMQSELEKHRDKLEILVKKRTEELETANKELNSINEEFYITNEMLVEERNRLHKALQEINEIQKQLIKQEKMASIGTLTAGIAHELNNPINFISSGITGLSFMIEEMTEITNEFIEVSSNISNCPIKEKINATEIREKMTELLEEFPPLMNSIKNGVNRTTNIVKGLRTFSRLDNENSTKADIHHIIDSTLTILHNKYKNRIEIKKNYTEIPEIYCYPGKLGQAFLNILVNSIQAIQSKGIIEISTGISEKEVFIKIKDNGAGIPKKIVSKIFDPFFTTKGVGEGTGLGLSIVHGIIEEHNGTIKVKTKEDKGTEFIINLPIHEKAES